MGPAAMLKPPGNRPSPIKSWRPSPWVTNGMPWDSSAAFASARVTGFAVWKTVTISGCLMCRDTSRETAGESRPCPWYRVRPPAPRGCARWQGTRDRTRNRPATRPSCTTPPDSRERAEQKVDVARERGEEAHVREPARQSGKHRLGNVQAEGLITGAGPDAQEQRATPIRP